MSIFELDTPAYFLPQRAIEAFSTYITIEEVATDDVEITQHPVQSGAAISDHAYKKPAVVAIRGSFSQARTQEPLAQTYQRLLALQKTFRPFTVVTGKRQYENMIFKSLGQTTDGQTEGNLTFLAELQEVIIVSTQVVSVPARSKQANPGKTGATENGGKKQLAKQGTDGSETGPNKVPTAFRDTLHGLGIL